MIRIGAYVRLNGFEPGHALYLAEGEVQGTVPDGKGGELVQVLLSRPRTSRGLLTHVAESRIEVRRRR